MNAKAVKQISIWAVMNRAGDGKHSIVGLASPSFGQMACVSSNEDAVREMWKHVAPEVQRTSQIVHFTAEVAE